MRIGSVQPGRPEYYDRNPVGKSQFFSVGAAAPHAVTTRWSYTVPTAKKSFLQSSSVTIQRTVATGGPGVYAAAIQMTPTGGGVTRIIQALSMDGTLGATTDREYAGVGAMLAGDVLDCFTTDFSVGGNVDYYLAAWHVEYDA